MIRFWRWIFATAFLAVTALSLTPQADLPPIPIWDKLAHGLTFTVLVVLARFGWPQVGTRKIAILLVAYGLFIEVAQLFIPGRSFSLLDLLADAIGIGLGTAAVAVFFRLTAAIGRNPSRGK